MRLDRFICKSTDLARPDAVAAIKAGRVCINAEPALHPATQLYIHQQQASQSVTLDGQALTLRPFRYIMLHKPAGMICSNVDEHYPSLFRLLDIERPDELHVVGRLDADTTGLVLLTDDGHWSFAITNPKSDCNKVYRVILRDPLVTVAQVEALKQRFAEGMTLQGEAKLTRPAMLEVLSEYQVLLTLNEGRFHQIKRMFAAVGNRVQQLHRIQIGSWKLDIDEGEWRYLSDEEIQKRE